jgi:integrase
MASIKFRIKGSSKKGATIYMRLSISRDNLIEIKSGFSIHPDSWSTTTSYPKQNSANTKLLFNELKKLESSVFESLNLAQAKGEILDKVWLEEIVSNCFNRVKKKKGGGLADHIQYIIDNASTRKIAGQNRLGLSKARIQSYKSFKKNMEEFEKSIKKQIQLVDLNSVLIEKYKNWLLKTKSFSVNYAGKQLDNLRAVGRDALRLNIPTNLYVNNMESFSESDENRHIVTLSNEELEKIWKTEMPSSYLVNAKKWLLLGCEIGQRGGDLLSVTPKNIRYVEGHLFIDVLQQKTNKEVTIPVGSREIRKILEDDFPRPISSQKLNKYIKTVSELAGLNEVIEGKLLDKTLNRKIIGNYPKHQLITTHSFRRSFATNYYKKIATPILMTITGHGKESMFLKYINKQEDKDENAKLFLKYYEEMKQG